MIRMRVGVIAPPAGVAIAMQRGRTELLPPARTEAGAIWFEFSLRVGTPDTEGSPNFLGDMAQGPRGARFVYINSGVRAGDAGSCWDRRAKLKLAGIPRAFFVKALKDPDGVIEAQIPGTMRDSGPICASIPAAAVQWRWIEVASENSKLRSELAGMDSSVEREPDRV